VRLSYTSNDTIGVIHMDHWAEEIVVKHATKTDINVPDIMLDDNGMMPGFHRCVGDMWLCHVVCGMSYEVTKSDDTMWIPFKVQIPI